MEENFEISMFSWNFPWRCGRVEATYCQAGGLLDCDGGEGEKRGLQLRNEKE